MKYLQYLFLGLVGLFLASMALGGLTGQPVLLSYVESGSMEPTIETNDGFVVVPTVASGDIEEGDVIVFEAQHIQDGELTTHRVVDVTDRGYVTQGDANPSTDQAAGEPLVVDSQIRGTALQVGGDVVVLPKLGVVTAALNDALNAVQRRLAATFGTNLFLGSTGMAVLVMAFGGMLILYDVIAERGRTRDVSRSYRRAGVYDARKTAIGVAVAVMVVSSAGMVVASSTLEYPMVSSSTDSERYNVVEAGTTTSVEYTLHNGGPVPMYSFIGAEGGQVEVGQEVVYLGPGSTVENTFTVAAPEETGFYPQYVSERRYFALLPKSVTADLHDIHPVVPTVVIGGLLGLASMLLTLLFLGFGVVRTRSVSRS